MRKYILVLTLMSCAWMACTDAGTNEENANAEETVAKPENPEMAAGLGKILYTQQCQLCHGPDGKLGASGAKDLSVSTLSPQDAINVVTYGRGQMQAYQGFLTHDQIKNVVAYILTLRKK